METETNILASWPRPKFWSWHQSNLKIYSIPTNLKALLGLTLICVFQTSGNDKLNWIYEDNKPGCHQGTARACLLYTSDAADE